MLSVTNARHAKMIEDYWAAKGHTINTSLKRTLVEIEEGFLQEEDGFEKYHLESRPYVIPEIVSDMVNGMPTGAHWSQCKPGPR